MPPHAPATPSPFDATASRQRALRDRTAIQREVVQLLDGLAPSAVRAARHEPTLAPRSYRWPHRCILQGESQAVSITWFAGSGADESLGELLVVSWRGTVTLPGSGRRVHEQATLVTELLLHPQPSSAGEWVWSAAAPDTTVVSTAELSSYCRAYVAPTDAAASSTAAIHAHVLLP